MENSPLLSIPPSVLPFLSLLITSFPSHPFHYLLLFPPISLVRILLVQIASLGERCIMYAPSTG